MENCFTGNPIKVKFVNETKKILHTFVFIGDVPKSVLEAIDSLEVNELSKHQGKILREYYGARWKTTLEVKTSGGANDGAIDGANDGSDDDLDIDLDDIDDISNIKIDDADLGLDIDIDQSDQVKDSNDTDDLQSGEYQLDKRDIDDLKQAVKSKIPKVSVVEENNFSPEFEEDGKVTYITDIHVFPEDKISELREKIYATSGVPPYRQHLYWISQDRITHPYKIYADGIYEIDIKDTFNVSDSINNVLGIPVDKLLYNLRNELKIESNDQFTLLGNLRNANTFYIVDCDRYISDISVQLSSLIEDTYKFELFYYGFIVKFWPQMTAEVFRDYITSEQNMPVKYPDLSRNRTILRKLHSMERKIVNGNYRNKNKIKAAMGKNTIKVAITSLIATTIAPTGTVINIRNLFDKLPVNKCRPQIHAYVTYEGQNYMLKKKHAKNKSDISFPSALKSGIVIAISLKKRDQESYHAKSSISTIENEQSRYLFLNILPNGQYYLKSVWGEEDELDFTDVLKIMKKFTEPIIEEINNLGKYIFISGRNLNVISKSNVKYKSINVCIFWKRLMSESTFKIIKSYWDSYVRAGIISSRGIQQSGIYEFMFRKGITEFDLNLIERVLSAANLETMRNHYSRYSDNTLKQKWQQLYDGRVIKMIHRTTDVKFDVTNIKEQEFDIFFVYLVNYILNSSADNSFKTKTTTIVSSEKIKKLKKLRETDPELYNLKKYGSKKVYSILCQNPRQPIIYTDDEIDRMPQKSIKELEKYWNFTLNKPAYYGCPNSKYPHLSFIVGVHPNNYCLPCCGKSAAAVESKKRYINKICLDKYEFSEDEMKTKGDISGLRSRHVMNYGKEIDVGRISKLPPSAITGLLYNSREDDSENYYVFGVPQNFPSAANAGVLYALAETMGITPVETVDRILKELKSNPKLFSTLLNGAVISTFKTSKNLEMYIKDIFINHATLSFSQTNKFTKWNELFIELAMLVLDIYIFTFIDDTGRGETTDLFITDALKSEVIYMADRKDKTTDETKYALMIQRKEKFYPVFVIDINKYFKYNEISVKTFTINDSVVKYMYSIITSVYKSASEYNKTVNVNVVKEFINQNSEYKITHKYINKRNLVYALLLKNKNNDNIYFPIDYSAHITDSIKPVFNAFVRSEYKLKLSSLEEFIEKLNEFIVKNYSANTLINQRKNAVYKYSLISPLKYITIKNDDVSSKKLIGFYSTTSLVFYFTINDGNINDKLPIQYIEYDPDDVNKTIYEEKDKSDDGRTTLVSQGLYKNYLYNIFVLEFVNLIEKERNNSIRKRILDVIETTNIKKEGARVVQDKIKKIIENYPEDIKLLYEQLSDFYYEHFNKKVLVDSFNNTIYDFDRFTLNKLKKLPTVDLKAELKKITADIVVEKDIDVTKITFPNIYLPCEYYSSSGSYCEKKKLIVTPDPGVDNLIELLARDILNPLKEKYMFSGLFSENIINYFKFEDKAMEAVTIFKI